MTFHPLFWQITDGCEIFIGFEVQFGSLCCFRSQALFTSGHLHPEFTGISWNPFFPPPVPCFLCHRLPDNNQSTVFPPSCLNVGVLCYFNAAPVFLQTTNICFPHIALHKSDSCEEVVKFRSDNSFAVVRGALLCLSADVQIYPVVFLWSLISCFDLHNSLRCHLFNNIWHSVNYKLESCLQLSLLCRNWMFRFKIVIGARMVSESESENRSALALSSWLTIHNDEWTDTLCFTSRALPKLLHTPHLQLDYF